MSQHQGGVGSYIEELWESLGPLRDKGDAGGLRAVVEGYAWPFQPYEDLGRETDEGPAWSMAMDVERARPASLPWLAQFVGVRLDVGISEELARERIRQASGFRRGTPRAMREAAQETLTGNRTVFFQERHTSAYTLAVSTYASETPDPDATEAALRAQKPAGIVLTYQTVGGGTYAEAEASFADYAEAEAAYASYDDARLGNPI